jgi:hypothetical protein
VPNASFDTRFIGEALFHASGWNSQQPYSWTVPDASNIDYISVVCVGGGGSGEMQHDGASAGGGALAYKNDIPISPGAQVEVYVGGGGRNPNGSLNSTQYSGNPSYIRIAGVNYAVAGGGTGGTDNPSEPRWQNISGGTWNSNNADGGGNGGGGTDISGARMGGGGAGGYSGNGGSSGPANGYTVPGFPGQPQPGNGGGGAGGNSQNSSNGAGGGGGTGVYGEGTSGVAGTPASNWYENYGRGGSTAYNTGLNGYIAYPTSINNIPGVNRPSGYWGDGPTPNPNIYANQRSDGPVTQYVGDGGFCGGGGCGGHSSSHAGAGGHGMVRIVYGYNGPVTDANKRKFPTDSVLRSDEYANNTNPAKITIDDINGVQLMY